MNSTTHQSASSFLLDRVQVAAFALQSWLSNGRDWQDARRETGASDDVHAHHRQSAGVACMLLHGILHDDVIQTAMRSVHDLYGEVVTAAPIDATSLQVIESMTAHLHWLMAGVPNVSKMSLPRSFQGYLPMDNMNMEPLEGDLIADGRRNWMRTLSDVRDTVSRLERAANWLARSAITEQAVTAVNAALDVVEEIRTQCKGLEQQAKDVIQRVKQAQVELLMTNARSLVPLSGLKQVRFPYAGNVAPDESPLVCDRHMAALLSAVHPDAKRRWCVRKTEPTHSADLVQQSFDLVAHSAKNEAEILGVTYHEGQAVALVVPCQSTNPDDVIAVDAHKLRFLLETVEWNGLNMGEKGVALLWQGKPGAVMTHVYTARYDSRTTYRCKVDVAEARRVRASWLNPVWYEQRWIERAAQLVASAEETAQTC